MRAEEAIYQHLTARLEPDIAAIDTAYGLASIAVSAKRQAAALERIAMALEAHPPQAYGDAIGEAINNALLGNSPYVAGQSFGAGMGR